MKEDRTTKTSYSRLIESHWDSTIELERLSVNPATPLEERKPAKQTKSGLDNLSSLHGEADHAKSYWDSDIVLENFNLNPTPRHEKRNLPKEESESKSDSSFEHENINTKTPPLNKAKSIESHWDFAIELERVSINPSPTYEERVHTKTGIVSSINQILNCCNSGFAIMLLATSLSLFGFNRFFSSMLNKRKSNNCKKKRRSQDSSCNNYCSPTKKSKRATESSMNTDFSTRKGKEDNSVAGNENLLLPPEKNLYTESQKMDFNGCIKKSESESSLHSKREDGILGTSETYEEKRNLDELCEKSPQTPTATTEISSILLAQSSESESCNERENSNISSSLRLSVESDVCRRGSSVTEQQLREMSNEIELVKEVFGVQGARQFVQQRHLLEYQESMRREHDNQRLISEFQVRQMEMQNTERRHQELMAKQEDGHWASKCIRIRDHILYTLQRTAIWLVVLIFLDQAADIGLQTIRSDLFCTCQTNPSQFSVKVFLCSSMSPSFLCQMATTCWIGCASSWVVWVLALVVVRLVGMKFSDTLACGVGMLLWNQVETKSIYWCASYLCFTAFAYILILIRGHQMQLRLRSSGCRRMETLADYELECDQFKIGVVLLMGIYFCFFQVAENGFLQQCARTYISYEYYQ